MNRQTDKWSVKVLWNDSSDRFATAQGEVDSDSSGSTAGPLKEQKAKGSSLGGTIVTMLNGLLGFLEYPWTS